MKKLIITCFIASLAFVANAQIGAGIKAGVNFANQSIETVDTGTKTGYHFGAFFTIGSESIALQPEILFSKQGSDLTIGSFSDEVDYSFLTIPILVKFNFLKVLNVHVGPQVNLLFNADLEDAATEITDDLKSADFAIAAGAGVNLPAGLTGGFRYIYSFTDLNDGYSFNGVTAPDIEITNRNLQIYLGYRLFGNSNNN